MKSGGKSLTHQALFRLLTRWQAPVEDMPNIIVNPMKEFQSMDYKFGIKHAICQDYLD